MLLLLFLACSCFVCFVIDLVQMYVAWRQTSIMPMLLCAVVLPLVRHVLSLCSNALSVFIVVWSAHGV